MFAGTEEFADFVEVCRELRARLAPDSDETCGATVVSIELVPDPE